jgi:hypothetical protein
LVGRIYLDDGWILAKQTYTRRRKPIYMYLFKKNSSDKTNTKNELCETQCALYGTEYHHILEKGL